MNKPPCFDNIDFNTMDPMEISADSERTLKQIKECVQFKDSKGLKTFILEHKLAHTNIFWEVTSELVNSMTHENLNNHTYFFESCERCLNYIVENGNPKEILLALLEQADCFKDDEKFKVILSNVQTVLLKLPAKRHHSLDITMETLSAHIEALPALSDHDLEGEEWKLLDLDPEVSRTHDVVKAYLLFLKPFIWEVSTKNSETDRTNRESQIKMLTGYLLRLLHHPLLYLHMRFNPKEEAEKKKMYGRELGEMLIDHLTQLCPSFWKLIDTEKKKHYLRKKGKQSQAERKRAVDHDDIVKDWKKHDDVSELSLACLLYLVLKEYLGIDNFPAIFTNQYLLQYCLPYIKLLLEVDHSFVKFKGLYLLQTLVYNILPGSLQAEDLEQDIYKEVLQLLIHIDDFLKMKNQELRQLCVTIFPVYVNMFSLAGRYRLFEIVFRTCHHAGMIGYTIGLYKGEVDKALRQDRPDRHYVGRHLQNILKLVTGIPNGATTDLLDNSDRIFAVLNFLRYLTLRDAPNVNITGIWDYYPVIEKDFFGPSETCNRVVQRSLQA
ncbi:hypothetical protein FSP39_018974 [Pinctada imbricata]|uniref:Uncharacterized protein n=1 Tax=Pinctada imbricata TaxID=66713 RepID=A0AA89C202_PINIB|nr:hypothetical protein FSP39_018974 [Pinctada imbricata]